MQEPGDLALEAEACRALWLAVLLQGLDEARAGDARWLGSRDFYTVASLAGIDGDAARAIMRRPGAVMRQPASPGLPRRAIGARKRAGAE